MDNDTKWVMEIFSDEALQAQDGKEVPLTLYPGGPVIGQATLCYDPGDKALKAALFVDGEENPVVADFLKGNDLSGYSIKES